MNKLFYPKLAAQNISKNRKFYLPYFLTCIMTIAGFYNICAIANDDAISEMRGSQFVSSMMFMGIIIVAMFSIIFLFYTNSFLMKRRNKEIGLYNILGMSKKNISIILTYETLFVGIGSIAAGIGLGVLLHKLLMLILYRILSFDVQFGTRIISTYAVIVTIAVFAVIFILNFIYNIMRIRISKPIELLYGSVSGEKEPKANWLIAVIGVLCLGGGYFIALANESPLDAIFLFFIAVALVIIGTYCLFTAGSVTVLKLLRKNKKFYYNKKHFAGISGMIYRMRRNAAGLSNICILSTMVLVMISGTVCLYLGTEDLLNAETPHDASVSLISGFDEADYDAVRTICREEAGKAGITMNEAIDATTLSFTAVKSKNTFEPRAIGTTSNLDELYYVNIITQSEYERSSGTNLGLKKNQIATNAVKKDDMDYNSVVICGQLFNIAYQSKDLKPAGSSFAYLSTFTDIFFVLPDQEAFDAIYQKQLDVYKESASKTAWVYSFDLDASGQELTDCCNNIRGRVMKDVINKNNDQGMKYHPFSFRHEFSAEAYAMTGSFLFLGIFLGILFIMATALIIYYKQISEGYDDREKYVIMQKVGMSKAEVKKTVASQVLTVFFLPLAVAIIHLAVAFKIIVQLLALFKLSNVLLFFICAAATSAVFALVYAAVYAATARTYYKIIS